MTQYRLYIPSLKSRRCHKGRLSSGSVFLRALQPFATSTFSGIFFFALVVLVRLPDPACAEATSRHLRSASELDYPPFAIVHEDGSAGGFSVDLLQAVALEAGMTVSFEIGPWNTIKSELERKQLDVLPLVSYSKERDRYFDFSTPYLTLSGTIFVRSKQQDIRQTADLRDKEVLVMRGDTAHEYALRNNLSDHLILTDTYEEAFRLLSAGQHDAIIVQQIVGFQIVKNLQIKNVLPLQVKDIKTLKPVSLKLEGFTQHFCFAVQEGQYGLLSKLNEGLAVTFLNGTYDRLYEKWFSPILPEPEITPAHFIQLILAITGIVVLVLMTLGMWYFKRAVKAKTNYLQQEIAHRREIENELANSNERYRKAQAIGKVGNWEYDIRKDSFWCSEETQRFLNSRPPSKTINFALFKSIFVEQDLLEKGLEQLALAGKPFETELTICNENKTRIVSLVAEPIPFEPGKAEKIHGVILDITERRKEQEKFQKVFAGNPDAISIATMDSETFLEVNELFFQLTGYTRDEVIGSSSSKLNLWLNAEERNRYKEEMDNNGCVRNFETQFRMKSGNLRYIILQSEIIELDGKQCSLNFMRDVHELRLIEEEKNTLQTHLLQAQKMEAIGTLAGGIAHDFNNILGVIYGYADMAREDVPNHSVVAAEIDSILEATQRAKSLVKQILVFSRQAQIEQRHVQLENIINDAIKILRPTLPSTISIHSDIAPDLNAVHADPMQLHQIVMNLATNAFHAMEDTGGTLSLSLHNRTIGLEDLDQFPDINTGEFVELSVADDGSGIPPDVMERMYDPYFTTKEIGKGTGLGLSIVHGLVKDFKGAMLCDSQVGLGTTFTLLFPAIDEPVELSEGKVGSIPVGKERILFVDDEPTLARVYSGMLKRLGYTVTTKNNSFDALYAFSRRPHEFDLLITDQTMPEMTGLGLSEKVLAIRPDMPIILCTGHDNSVPEEHFIRLGISSLVLKPVSKAKLALLIRKILDT